VEQELLFSQHKSSASSSLSYFRVLVHFRAQIASVHEYSGISHFNTHRFKLIFQASASLSPDSSCVSSDKESAVDAELENGDEELRAERNMPPIAGPCGAPRMLPHSFGAVIGIPPDNYIHRDVLFEMPPSMTNEQAVAAGAKPESDKDMDTKLTELIDTIFGDQATVGAVFTNIILHRRQKQSRTLCCCIRMDVISCIIRTHGCIHSGHTLFSSSLRQ
jgi:hypothetical protein